MLRLESMKQYIIDLQLTGSSNRPRTAAAAGLSCFQRQEENRRAGRTALVVRSPRRKAERQEQGVEAALLKVRTCAIRYPAQGCRALSLTTGRQQSRKRDAVIVCFAGLQERQHRFRFSAGQIQRAHLEF